MTRAPHAGPAIASLRFRRALCAAGRGFRARLLAQAPRDDAAEARIDARATAPVEAIRARTGGLGGIEDFLHAYSLSTKEGLALMVLAEALLRVPDAATADRLIEDKLAAGDWSHPDVKSDALLVSASAWALGVSARHHPAGRDAGKHPRKPGQAARPAGGAHRDAAGDAAARLAFRARPDASRRRSSAPRDHREFALLLRHAGRGRAHARRTRSAISQLMRDAIEAIGKTRRQCAPCPTGPGISVKLSALHPRYEAISRERVLAELTPQRAGACAQGQSA